MKIVVTGGSGFIGSRLIQYLMNKDYDVINFDIKEGHDISDYNDVHSFLRFHQPDYIYHTAAQSFLRPGEESPHADVKVNIFGMINILKAMEYIDLDAILLYTSTGAVYGLSELPHREDLVCKPMGNYGISKLAAEKYLQKWVTTQGFDAKIVRFSSVYGHKRRAGPVNIFCSQALEGGPITVFGSGSQTRDVVHIDDVTGAMERVAERGRRGHIYNVGTGEEHSVIEIARLVKKRSRKDLDIEFVKHEASPFDLPRSWFDITKAKGLGWEPKIDLDLGIQLTLHDLEQPD